jgi:AraC-like DNA-binding protein
MDDILVTYDLEVKKHFRFLENEDLMKFMHSSDSAHSHNYYIISILYEGSIAHLSDFDQELVRSPAILMLDIDQVHTHPDLNGCKMISIGFSTDFIADQNKNLVEIVNKLFSVPFNTISSQELKQLDEIVKMIARENSDEEQNYELIKALLNVLLIQCLKFSESSIALEGYGNAVYSGFRMLLKENFRQQHQVKFYADRLNVTTRILTQNVRTATFKTPKQLVDEHLLLEAKRILFWSVVPVKEIAWQLGFETDSYFNRFFKKHTGLTPKDFQRKQLEENKKLLIN